MGYQHVVIVGNVGSDPEIQYTSSGVAVCKFTVAVSKVTGKGQDKKEKTVWFKVVCWRERAETASQYVAKGMKILVSGEVEASAYTNKQGKPAASLELTANDFQFLSEKGNKEQSQQSSFDDSNEPF